MRIDRYYLDEWEVHVEERQFLTGLRRIYWLCTFLLFGLIQLKSILLSDYNLFGTFTILLVIIVLLEWQYPYLPPPKMNIALTGILSFIIAITYFYEELRVERETQIVPEFDLFLQIMIALFVFIRMALVIVGNDFLEQRKRNVIPKTQPAKERLVAYYGILEKEEEDVKSSIQSTKDDVYYYLLGSIPLLISLFLALLAAFAINTIDVWKEAAQPLTYEPIFLLIVFTGFIMLIFSQRKITKLSKNTN
jgi:hypothetical protein